MASNNSTLKVDYAPSKGLPFIGGGGPAEKEKPGDADEIEPGDALVIQRQQPAFQSVTGVQIVHGASGSSGVRDWI